MKESVTPKPSWASEKVRVYSPQSKEKSTLYFIASQANPQGYGSYVGYARLAKDTGHSIRTVRRHVKELIRRGELISWCSLVESRRSNEWYIPIAAETIDELEARTGISRTQLKLPLVQCDRGAVSLSSDGVQCPSSQDKVALDQGQSDPQSFLKQENNKDSGSFSLILRKERQAMDKERSREKAEEKKPLASETEALIRDTIAKMSMDVDRSAGLGTAARRSVWGDLTEEEIARERSLALEGR